MATIDIAMDDMIDSDHQSVVADVQECPQPLHGHSRLLIGGVCTLLLALLGLTGLVVVNMLDGLR